ncbi:hypothetical protein F4811DRAFT_74462 [Daldinia bambusicola]|nr:hypothetical protein F4811DRAFT_74462 [Daldinia bambusicola]
MGERRTGNGGTLWAPIPPSSVQSPIPQPGPSPGKYYRTPVRLRSCDVYLLSLPTNRAGAAAKCALYCNHTLAHAWHMCGGSTILFILFYFIFARGEIKLLNQHFVSSHRINSIRNFHLSSSFPCRKFRKLKSYAPEDVQKSSMGLSTAHLSPRSCPAANAKFASLSSLERAMIKRSSYMLLLSPPRSPAPHAQRCAGSFRMALSGYRDILFRFA